MNFEVEGLLHKIFETEAKTESFQAREFVISTEGNYPQFVKFQLTQDRCGIVDNYKEGEKVKVHFDLRGREWQGKYFTNLNAWRIDKVAMDAAPDFPDANEMPPSGFEEFSPQSTQKNSSTTPPDLEDLPF
jgi:hypothetical protein